MDESAQWHMGKVSSKEAEVRWAIEEAEKLSDLESKSSSLDCSTPTSESNSDALCNEEWWAEKNEMANILVVLRKEEENNKGMTSAERSEFGFCGTISTEFCNAARKVCNLAGAKRTEMGTVRAVRAVYARAYYGHVYRTHKDAVDAHKASLRNFMYWKRKLGWMAAKYGYPELIFEGKEMIGSGRPAGKAKSSNIPRPVAVRAEPVGGMDATVKPPSGKTPLQADPTQMAKARLLLGFSGGELNDDKTRKDGFGHEVMSRFRTATALTCAYPVAYAGLDLKDASVTGTLPAAVASKAPLLNEDGSRKDGFGHEVINRLEAEAAETRKNDGKKDSVAEARATCMLPGCEPPVYIDADGKAHECCGRTHATALAYSSAGALFRSVG